MFCYDFNFNGEKLSDHGLVICSFDSEATQSGGDVVFNTAKPPYSNRTIFYNSNFEEMISFQFQIGKDPCGNNDQFFSAADQSDLKRWLKRTDRYHWLYFLQEGFDNIFFHCQFNLQPLFFCGKVIGYHVTCNTDSPYGYGVETTHNLSLAPGEYTAKMNLSDINDIIYPEVTITSGGYGTIGLETGVLGRKHTTKITNVSQGDVIVLNGEYDYFSGIKYPDFFVNFEFPIVAREYESAATQFKNVGDVSFTAQVKYRPVRMVDI